MQKLQKTFKSGLYKKHFEGREHAYKSFIPNYINREYASTDRRIPLLLEEANRLLGELNAYSLLVPDVDFFIQMHVKNEAVKSSRIEGTRTEIEEVILQKEDVSPEKRDDWIEVRNYIAAMNYAIGQLNKLPVSMRLLNQTHRILLSGARGEKKQPGVIRTSQNWVGGSNIQNASFVPPHPEEVPALLSDLEKFRHNNSLRIPVLVKTAMCHYQFETIHPYLDGNGRIGRLLIILQLIEKNFLSLPTLYISDFFEKNKTDYYDNLMMARTNNDVDNWIRFFLSGIIATADKGKRRFAEIIALRTKYEQIIMGFGRRAKQSQRLLLYLFSNPAIQAKEAADYLNVAYNTANTLISLFAAAGILTSKIKGRGRNRIFIMREYINLFKE